MRQSNILLVILFLIIRSAKYDNTDERTKQIIQFDHLDDKEIDAFISGKLL